VGIGDGFDIGVVSTPFGVVGGLLCWETSCRWPERRSSQHCDIYLAPTWDNSDTWAATLRHIAKESSQFAIGVAPLPCAARSDGRLTESDTESTPHRSNSLSVS
jgi:nitrilase